MTELPSVDKIATLALSCRCQRSTMNPSQTQPTVNSAKKQRSVIRHRSPPRTFIMHLLGRHHPTACGSDSQGQLPAALSTPATPWCQYDRSHGVERPGLAPGPGEPLVGG